jgi:hypothetical protein
MTAVLLSTRCRRSALKATMLAFVLGGKHDHVARTVIVLHDLLKPAA